MRIIFMNEYSPGQVIKFRRYVDKEKSRFLDGENSYGICLKVEEKSMMFYSEKGRIESLDLEAGNVERVISVGQVPESRFGGLSMIQREDFRDLLQTIEDRVVTGKSLFEA